MIIRKIISGAQTGADRAAKEIRLWRGQLDFRGASI